MCNLRNPKTITSFVREKTGDRGDRTKFHVQKLYVFFSAPQFEQVQSFSRTYTASVLFWGIT